MRFSCNSSVVITRWSTEVNLLFVPFTSKCEDKTVRTASSLGIFMCLYQQNLFWYHQDPYTNRLQIVPPEAKRHAQRDITQHRVRVPSPGQPRWPAMVSLMYSTCSRTVSLNVIQNSANKFKFKFKHLYCLLYIQCISSTSMQQRKDHTN